jgi:hypothetical protein
MAQLLMLAGFERLQMRTADVLVEVMVRYLELLATTCKASAEHAGRTDANFEDAFEALDGLGVRAEDLREFARYWTAAGKGRHRNDGGDQVNVSDPKGKGKPMDNDGEQADEADGDAGGDRGEAPDENGQVEDFRPATQGSLLGEFLRLPPGPFPISGCSL